VARYPSGQKHGCIHVHSKIFVRKSKLLVGNTLVLRPDRNTNSQIAHVRVWVLGFPQQERKRRGGRTCRVPFADEGPSEELAKGTKTCAPGVRRRRRRRSAVQSSRRSQERDRARGLNGTKRERMETGEQSGERAALTPKTTAGGRPYSRCHSLGIRRHAANKHGSVRRPIHAIWPMV